MLTSIFLKNIFITIAPVFFQKLRFVRRAGYYPSISHPRTINELIFSLKINSSENDKIYVDKLLVRTYIENLIDSHSLRLLRLPEILLEESFANNFFENLPDSSCFIKANHGSGMCMQYDPIAGLNEGEKKSIQAWLNLDYAFYSGEKCYAGIKRKLFAEKSIVCMDGTLPDDVKVHCYCGQPAVIQVLRRSTGHIERQTFDERWEAQNWFENEVLDIDLSTVPTKEILEYTALLAQPFKYVRVDFYLVDGLLYFSELTLYPASGTLPLISKEVDLYLGLKYKEHCH
jgi:hypothetical protein